MERTAAGSALSSKPQVLITSRDEKTQLKDYEVVARAIDKSIGRDAAVRQIEIGEFQS